MRFIFASCAAFVLALSSLTLAQQGPYKVLKKEIVGGPGGFDYVFADSDGRKLYVPRTGGRGGPGHVMVYDLDTLKPVGQIQETNAVHGVAVDPKSHHGFTSSKPVVMFDTRDLKTLKNLDVKGNPDGILFDPATEHVFVLSHREPNVTVISAADGAIIGTISLGGQPEQAASDGQGHLYIDLEDKDSVAAVDAKSLKVTAHYDLSGKGGGLAGLAMDTKNRILFSCGRKPQSCVVLNADTGRVITTLPIGNGVDAAEFNPETMEAFSSQRDGTLTVIKEKSPTEFEVEQTVQTMQGAKTSTLDSKTGHILLISSERGVTDSFTIIVVGK